VAVSKSSIIRRQTLIGCISGSSENSNGAGGWTRTSDLRIMRPSL
jgi:hypothetical protein